MKVTALSIWNLFDNQPLSNSVFRIISRQPKHGKVIDSYTGTAYAVLHGLCEGVGSNGGWNAMLS